VEEIVLPDCPAKEIELVVITRSQIYEIVCEFVATLAIGGIGLWFVLPSGFWRAGLLSLLIIARLWQHVNQIKWDLLRLSVGRDGLRIARQGRTV